MKSPARLAVSVPGNTYVVLHCTLRTRSPVSDAEARELLQQRVDGRVTLDTLSL